MININKVCSTEVSPIRKYHVFLSFQTHTQSITHRSEQFKNFFEQVDYDIRDQRIRNRKQDESENYNFLRWAAEKIYE